MATPIPPLPTRLTLEIVTPDHSLVHEDVDEVVVPAADGYLGVLPGHTPLLALLKVGELWYRKGTEKFYLHIAFGFAEVLPDRVTILADIAERPEDIDIARAEQAKKRAQQRLEKPTVEIDFERARIAMMKSLIRLQVASRARTRV
jgi:F-type H+-transporting ATPase subunit epsilon